MIDLSKYEKLIAEGTIGQLTAMDQRRKQIDKATKDACLLMADHMLRMSDISDALKELFIILDTLDPLNTDDIAKCNKTIFNLFRQICAEKVITSGFYAKILSFPFSELFGIYEKASKFFMENKNATNGNTLYLDQAADFPFSFIDDEVIRNRARENLKRLLAK